jgi:hypothetical protein
VVAAAIRKYDFEAFLDRDLLRLRGSADGRSAEQLEELVTQAHRALQARHAPACTIDLREVAIMSDSCFNVLATWIDWIHAMPVAERYELRFAIDPAIPWQRRTVVTLSAIASDVVKLDS